VRTRLVFVPVSRTRYQSDVLDEYISTALEGHLDETQVVCDLFAQDIADLAALEFIAGLELSARAMGTHIVLRNIQDEMRSLIELAGLAAVFDEAADRGARS
jgi:anti-anti-sigma regulatory factor